MTDPKKLCGMEECDGVPYWIARSVEADLARLADDGCPHHDEPAEASQHRCPDCGKSWAGCICPHHDEPDEFFDDGEEEECPHCDGDGEQRIYDVNGGECLLMVCPHCGGTGWL